MHISTAYGYTAAKHFSQSMNQSVFPSVAHEYLALTMSSLNSQHSYFFKKLLLILSVKMVLHCGFILQL